MTEQSDFHDGKRYAPGLYEWEGALWLEILQAYGCGACGQGFWIEENSPRESPPAGSTLYCPRCGSAGSVPDREVPDA